MAVPVQLAVAVTEPPERGTCDGLKDRLLQRGILLAAWTTKPQTGAEVPARLVALTQTGQLNWLVLVFKSNVPEMLLPLPV